MTLQITPRILRYRDAPNYLGMDRNKFATEVRVVVTFGQCLRDANVAE